MMGPTEPIAYLRENDLESLRPAVSDDHTTDKLRLFENEDIYPLSRHVGMLLTRRHNKFPAREGDTVTCFADKWTILSKYVRYAQRGAWPSSRARKNAR